MADKPFTPRKVINVHSHIHRTDDVARKVALWKEQGAVRTCVLCMWQPAGVPGFGDLNNEEFLPWLERYSDHLIGFGGLNQSESPDKPSAIGELHRKGFRGLKCIMPAKPYDDDSYMPLYEQAARHQMPILFHTGFLSFPVDYRGPGIVDFMRPSRLERIARYFPDLPLTGAHLGVGWDNEAIKLAVLRPNVYFDISGGGASVTHGSLIKRSLEPFAGADMANPDEHLALRLFSEKLVFGTDNPPLDRWVVRAENILDTLQIPAAIRENFYWRTAARILQLNM